MIDNLIFLGAGAYLAYASLSKWNQSKLDKVPDLAHQTLDFSVLHKLAETPGANEHTSPFRRILTPAPAHASNSEKRQHFHGQLVKAAHEGLERQIERRKDYESDDPMPTTYLLRANNKKTIRLIR
jgi:hypothetical protein